VKWCNGVQLNNTRQLCLACVLPWHCLPIRFPMSLWKLNIAGLAFVLSLCTTSSGSIDEIETEGGLRAFPLKFNNPYYTADAHVCLAPGGINLRTVSIYLVCTSIVNKCHGYLTSLQRVLLWLNCMFLCSLAMRWYSWNDVSRYQFATQLTQLTPFSLGFNVKFSRFQLISRSRWGRNEHHLVVRTLERDSLLQEMTHDC
jgi:hypothetical protein